MILTSSTYAGFEARLEILILMLQLEHGFNLGDQWPQLLVGYLNSGYVL